jgi:hypothetical protein
MDELEVLATAKHASVVERSAVFELVERDDVIALGVGQSQMADDPASTAVASVSNWTAELFESHTMRSNWNNSDEIVGNSHEASTTSDHNILDIREGLEFSGTLQYWGFLPDTGIIEIPGIETGSS